MKKIKLFLFVALFGAMSFGAFSAYSQFTMSVEEKAFLENVEALTSNEGGGSSINDGCMGIICYSRCVGYSGTNWGWAIAHGEKCSQCGAIHWN